MLNRTDVENIVAKGKIAGFEQLFLLDQFKLIYFTSIAKQLFENIVTKEEIAQNEQFLFLPQCFFTFTHRLNFSDLSFFDKICSKSSTAELSYGGKG